MGIRKLIKKMFNIKSSELNEGHTCDCCFSSETEIEKQPSKKESPSLDEIKEIVSKMTIDEMYGKSEFSVYQSVDDEEEEIKGDGRWYLYKAICQLGGCDHRGVPFDTEKEALEEAMILTLVGRKPEITPCPSCYAEYLKDCL